MIISSVPAEVKITNEKLVIIQALLERAVLENNEKLSKPIYADVVALTITINKTCTINNSMMSAVKKVLQKLVIENVLRPAEEKSTYCFTQSAKLHFRIDDAIRNVTLKSHILNNGFTRKYGKVYTTPKRPKIMMPIDIETGLELPAKNTIVEEELEDEIGLEIEYPQNIEVEILADLSEDFSDDDKMDYSGGKVSADAGKSGSNKKISVKKRNKKQKKSRKSTYTRVNSDVSRLKLVETFDQKISLESVAADKKMLGAKTHKNSREGFYNKVKPKTNKQLRYSALVKEVLGGAIEKYKHIVEEWREYRVQEFKNFVETGKAHYKFGTSFIRQEYFKSGAVDSTSKILKNALLQELKITLNTQGIFSAKNQEGVMGNKIIPVSGAYEELILPEFRAFAESVIDVNDYNFSKSLEDFSNYLEMSNKTHSDILDFNLNFVYWLFGRLKFLKSTVVSICRNLLKLGDMGKLYEFLEEKRKSWLVTYKTCPLNFGATSTEFDYSDDNFYI